MPKWSEIKLITAIKIAGLFTLLSLPPQHHLYAGVSFTEVAHEVGIDYRRTRSVRDSQFALYAPELFPELPNEFTTDCQDTINQIAGEDVFTAPPFPLLSLVCTPQKPRGAPGVCLFDYDRDGDQDIYVTNGPGTANSLYANQLVETGELRFIDRAATAGVTAADQDSAGCVAGDLDNDGDQELYVLGSGLEDANILYDNLGDGTFTNATTVTTAGGGRASVSATLADINQDGLPIPSPKGM